MLYVGADFFSLCRTFFKENHKIDRTMPEYYGGFFKNNIWEVKGSGKISRRKIFVVATTNEK